MANKLESLRPSHWGTPYNQRFNKYIRERQEKGRDAKAEKAERRKNREEQFPLEFLKMQFDRALGQMLNGTATEENIGHVFNTAHKYERVVETYETANKSTVTIAIIEFTPPNSKNLS